jgi:hypothetical protein
MAGKNQKAKKQLTGFGGFVFGMGAVGLCMAVAWGGTATWRRLSAGSGEISLIASATKKDWLLNRIERFNADHEGRYKIVPKFLVTDQAMHAIMEDREKPVLWSPSNVMWATRLETTWEQKYHGKIIDTSDPLYYRSYLRGPLVWLTTRQRVRELQPILSQPDVWVRLAQMDQSGGGAKFTYSYADPKTNDSGMLILGLQLAQFARANNLAGRVENAAKTPEFFAFLQRLQNNYVSTPDCRDDETLVNSFFLHPDRCGAILTYESLALNAAMQSSEVAVIYPAPTLDVNHDIALLEGDWVTPRQREGAQAFLDFLSQDESLRAGVDCGERLAVPGKQQNQFNDLIANSFQNQGFQQTYYSSNLPPYDAVNTAVYRWRSGIYKPPTATRQASLQRHTG